MSSFDIGAVRARFSSLNDDFVFLDAPGGTQTPDEVGAAVARVYREASGNTGAPYATSRRLGAVVADARAASARFLRCDPDEIMFGASTTALNFTLSRTLARELRAGDEILVTRLDHDANVAPWLDVARDLQLVIRHVDVRADTTLDMADLQRLLGPRTRVIAFPWASNAAGTTVDARAVCDLAHQAGALAWIDAVQYAPHEPIDVLAVGADVLLCSAYKFCGPHLGIAYGRRELLESWRPYKARPAPMEPLGHRFETGTLPYELLGGLIATFGYLESLGETAEMVAWERQLGERLIAGLPAGARLYGMPTMAGRVPTFLVNFPGVSSAGLSVALADLGFGVWSADHYYALGLHERIAWGEALRIGLAHYNTPAEVDRFNEALASLVPGQPGTRAGTPLRARPGRCDPGVVVTSGVVVRAGGIPAEQTATGAMVRTILDPGSGCPHLIRRLVEVGPGAAFDGTAGPAGELWFVISGSGRVELEGQSGARAARDSGLWIPPGARFRLQPDEPAGLVLDVVTLPAQTPAAEGRPVGQAGPGSAGLADQLLVSDLRDCEVEMTGDRRFRVLFGPGRGCPAATQFVGEIPPGRAPEHSHPYDEAVLVLAGEGVIHLGGASQQLSAGSVAYLPPGQPHCLENTGPIPLRVLGVFHPGGSPASKARAEAVA